MAKPATLFRWANVGGAVTTPTSGKQDIGYVPGEKPPAQWLNWKFLNIYEWCKYVDDAIFEDNTTFTDDVLIEGELEVDLLATFNDDVVINGSLSGGLQEHWFPIMMINGAPVDAGDTVDSVVGSYAAGGAYLQKGGSDPDFSFTLPLQVGRILQEVSLVCFDNSGGGRLRAGLYKTLFTGAPPGTITRIGDLEETAELTDFQEIGWTALAEPVLATTAIAVHVTMQSSADTQLYGIRYVTSGLIAS